VHFLINGFMRGRVQTPSSGHVQILSADAFYLSYVINYAFAVAIPAGFE